MSEDFSFDNSLGGAFAVIDNSTKFADMNKGIQPIFFTDDIEEGKATAEAGTLKVRSVEFVRLFTAGDMNSSPVHPVTAELKERFADAYEKWQRTRKNDHIDGMPLAAWPLASRGFVMEMKALHIRSVEDLANVADTNISKISDGRIWREKAKAWLDTNKDAGAAARYAARAEAVEADNADLRRQIADLGARLDALTENAGGSGPAPGRARTRAA